MNNKTATDTITASIHMCTYCPATVQRLFSIFSMYYIGYKLRITIYNYRI